MQSDPTVEFIKLASDDLTNTLIALAGDGHVKAASAGSYERGAALYAAADAHGLDLNELIDKQADFKVVADWMVANELEKAAGFEPAAAYEQEKAALFNTLAARAGGAFQNAVKAIINPVKDIAGKVRAGMQDYQLARTISKANVDPNMMKVPTPTVMKSTAGQQFLKDTHNGAMRQAATSSTQVQRAFDHGHDFGTATPIAGQAFEDAKQVAQHPLRMPNGPTPMTRAPGPLPLHNATGGPVGFEQNVADFHAQRAALGFGKNAPAPPAPGHPPALASTAAPSAPAVAAAPVAPMAPVAGSGRMHAALGLGLGAAATAGYMYGGQSPDPQPPPRT